MELKNLDNLIEGINYLNESEQLLQAIMSCYDMYEVCRKLDKDYWDKTISSKLQRHFDFDDSE